MPDRRCFVCAYATTPCTRSELVGEIRALEPELQGATLRLRLRDGSDAELALRPPWQRLVGDLEQHGLAFAGAERAVSLAAYHLQADPAAPGRWLAGREALVVLEPEWLEDVTSLTRTSYCERVYFVERFRADGANEATLKGNVVHDTFRQIVASPHDNELMQRALDQALRGNLVGLAALELDPDAVREAVVPALRQLVRWARTRAPAGAVRSETFLLAHRLGMRGRIDAAWERDGRVETVAELKSGKTWNGRARPEHELQVGAYGLMLAERGKADLRQERLLLLYAGNPEAGGRADLERQVPFRAQTFANLVHFRNRLVLIDLTGRAGYQPPSKCLKCRVRRHCHDLTELLEAPRCAAGCVLGKDCDGAARFVEHEREFFRHWVGLLGREWRAINDATAALWRTAPAVRCADGSAAEVLECAADGTTPDGGYLYRLRLGNDCEIRQNDRVILSEAGGPVAGRVAQVEVLEATGRALLVVLGEPLGFEPRWVDQLGSDRLFLRAYAGLYSWLAEPEERRELVTRLRTPRFGASVGARERGSERAWERGTSPSPERSEGVGETPGFRSDLPGGRRLNVKQCEALELALRAEEYALIQGPPGTGKTEVIAALARQLTDDGRRVFLLAGTNRALDRLLAACARLGLEERLVRLGSRPEPGSVGERRLLESVAWQGITEPSPTLPRSLAPALQLASANARQLLQASPIVASTIATLGGGPYAGLRGQFDTLVIDEASQVTLPAALGALGFARRFVLVGDHCQLPPVVHSAQDGERGLAESLFEHLARAREADGQPGLVRLDEQYRMNAEICAFPSAAWYGGALRPAEWVAGWRLGTVDGRTDRPVVFVDVPASPGDSPRTNRREARLARRVLEGLRSLGVPPRELAVIAPFRAQVALIRAELAESADAELGALAHELADTVDRFQGSERDAVVYSFSTFGAELHPLMLDERRLNVALTRARKKLVLLGDLRALRAYPRFAALEAYCRELYGDGGGVVRAGDLEE